RILHAYKTYRPETQGGIPTAIAALCGACPNAESVVLACGSPGETEVDSVRVCRAKSFGQLCSLPLAPSWPLHFWRMAAWADLVVVHAPFPLADFAVALQFPDHLALVVHWHSDIVSQRRIGVLVAPFTHILLARADAIVVTSPILADSPSLARYREKVVVVPFGIDVDSWNVPMSPDERSRSAILHACFPRLVVAIGRLVPYKGFETLIKAMQEVEAHLMIIGDGPQRLRLERQITDTGLVNRVTLCGATAPAELRLLLRNADVFTLPSVLPSETFGIAQLEAMACGRPVVNTDLPTGVPWVARDRHEALTVPPAQPRTLAAALQLLLDDRELARRLGLAGRARARSLFSLATFTHRVQSLYGRVMAEHGLRLAHIALRSAARG
ncbi:MAG TPA: glycosyltransferase, partial [Candidatus Saccharimonadales bacterium]|nr:glycosyltransferase [Candidatus Saccharimonadales bacterium]